MPTVVSSANGFTVYSDGSVIRNSDGVMVQGPGGPPIQTGSATPQSPVPGESVAVGQGGSGTNTGQIGDKNYNLPDGGYTMANDHGTYDQYNADGTMRRPGASGAQGTEGFNTNPGIGVDDWVNLGLAPVTGGTSLIPGSPTGIPGSAAQGAADAAMNGDSIIEGTWNGIKNDPAVQSVAGTVDKAVEGVGGLLGDLGLGGAGKAGKVDPYVVKPPPPVDATPFTAPLNALGQSAVASGTNWAGKQGDLAQQLLGAPSVAAAAGNAMAERTAQENAAQLASARGANTALLLRQAAGSADARTRGITSDLATAQAQETVDRTKAAGGLLGQAAGTENAGYSTGIAATGQASTIGANTAMGNNANTLTAEGINAGSYDTTNATNAGIGRDAAARTDKWIDRGLTAAGFLISDINNKQNVRPASGEFGPMLAMATDPQANRESLAPIQPATYEYKPGIAGMPGNDGAPRPGVMAQDLMKSPAGAEAVVETPNGKGIDMNRGLSLALASAAGLDKRMAELEAMLGQDEQRKRQAGAQQSSFTDSLRILGQSSPGRVMVSDENQKTKKKAYGMSP